MGSVQRVEKGSSEATHRSRPFQTPNHQLDAENEGLYEIYAHYFVCFVVINAKGMQEGNVGSP